MASKSVAFPNKTRLDAFLLIWLAQHPGLQRRRDLVAGAATVRSFPPGVRALPAHRADQQYPDLLHERLNYRVWALREAGLVENPVRGSVSPDTPRENQGQATVAVVRDSRQYPSDA